MRILQLMALVRKKKTTVIVPQGQGAEIADSLIKSGGIDVLVIDSVAALVPRAELEGDMGDHHVGLQARLMSQALRKITGNIQKII